MFFLGFCLYGYLQFTPMKCYGFFIALYFTIYILEKGNWNFVRSLS